jgi:hypothetical protein
MSVGWARSIGVGHRACCSQCGWTRSWQPMPAPHCQLETRNELIPNSIHGVVSCALNLTWIVWLDQNKERLVSWGLVCWGGRQTNLSSFGRAHTEIRKFSSKVVRYIWPCGYIIHTLTVCLVSSEHIEDFTHKNSLKICVLRWTCWGTEINGLGMGWFSSSIGTRKFLPSCTIWARRYCTHWIYLRK